MGRSWIDGDENGAWPVDDRGLRYGDGLFETMAARDGRIVHWDRHLRRQRRGCEALGIAGPPDATLADDLARLELPSQAVVRLVVTRGSGGRGYAPGTESGARRLWQVGDWPQIDPVIYDAGIRVAFLDSTLARQPALAGIKHLSRLEQVMAARELQSLDADDGLLCDETGALVEAVSANVFVRQGATVATPPIEACGVAGVVREVVLECAGEIGLAIAEQPLRRADVLLADEVFLTSSIRGVVPVSAVENVEFADFRAARAVREYLDARDH